MYYKIKQTKVLCIIDSGAEVSLIHIRVYNSLKEKPKPRKQSTFLHPV